MGVTTTTNLGLIKPDTNEPANNYPAQFGFNMETVDELIKVSAPSASYVIETASDPDLDLNTYDAVIPVLEATAVAGRQGGLRCDVWLGIEPTNGDDVSIRWDLEVRETDGSGTLIHDPNDGRTTGVPGSRYYPTNNNGQGTEEWSFFVFEGLIPGQQYWMQLQAARFTGTFDLIDDRAILAIPF